MTTNPKKSKDSLDLLRLRKEIWEKAVDTQMHFNEMSVKSRQLGLSFVVAALGLAVVLLTRDETYLVTLPIPLFDYKVTTHVSAIIVLIAVGGLYAVKVLDLGVYHRMLRGAVAFGEELEQAGLRNQLMKTPKGMTEFISLYSRHREVERKTASDGRNQYIVNQSSYLTAENKIMNFYHVTIWVLLAIGFILIVVFFKIEPTKIEPAQANLQAVQQGTSH
jgi:hypothetical protein